MKSILIALSLMGAAAFANPPTPPPIDACKTYFVCGTYAGLGDYHANGQATAKVNYMITASGAGPNVGSLHISIASKPYPIDQTVQLVFKPDGRFNLMAGTEIMGAGMCQAKMCTFALVFDPTDNDQGNVAMFRFNAGKMEFLWQSGTPAALTPQMQAVLPKTK